MGEDQIKELERCLDGILERLTRIETQLCERCDARGRLIESLKDRVHKLEIAQAKVVGAAILLGMVVNYILKGLGLE
ncbi:MAG: hypothetical protein LBV79_04120 [Candidatus Adiutrix sp.]|jgi:hypothetical protein|nr:hypothetical protein [Candidatus Adiutrix sp.]